MSIRRVALSGRFGRYDPLEVEEDLRVVFVKGVVLTTIDIVVTLAGVLLLSFRVASRIMHTSCIDLHLSCNSMSISE